jgi:hypothetical protein
VGPADPADSAGPLDSAGSAAAGDLGAVGEAQPVGYPPLPPGYVWAYPAPPVPPEEPWKAPRWLLYLTVVWIALLLGLAGFYVFHGRATVREQTSISQARPVVDAAVARVVSAAGSGPVVAVSAFQRTGSCKITVVRSGAQYQRAVDLYAAPGTESALLRTVADGLPVSYGAHLGRHGLTLSADAGDFVAVAGSVPSPGVVEIRALTGCRPDEYRVPAAVPAAPGTAESDAVLTAAAALGRGPEPGPVVVADLVCPGSGRAMRAVQVTTATSATSLGAALAALAPRPVLGTQNLVAYRSGAVDVVVRRAGGAVTVTGTTVCGQ